MTKTIEEKKKAFDALHYELWMYYETRAKLLMSKFGI